MSRASAPNVPWWSEPGLVLVHLAVAAGFARVYLEVADVVPLLAFALTAHVLAIVLRRSGAPIAASVLVAAIGLPLTATVLLFGDTTAWALPTSATWEAMRLAIDEAGAAFPEVVAPTEALPGFQLAAGTALWFAAWFGDATAHRVRATIEPIVTGASIFVLCTVLGSGAHRTTAAVGFGAAAVLYLAGQRAASLAVQHAWLSGRGALARSLATGALLLGGAALAVGTVVGPALPGADGEALVDWRGRDRDGARRITVSPIVEIRGRLVEQSDAVMFEVRSDEAAYWRLTSLDRFDGEIWSSDSTFRPAARQLPSDLPPAGEATVIDQQVRIRALSAIWVPVAYEAVSLLDASRELRWDADSSTLIVDSSQPSSDGLTYSAISRAPAFDPEQLAEAVGSDPADVRARYGGVPAGFPEEAVGLALAGMQRATDERATTRYAQALAMQAWFREEFRYSLEVPAGHSDDALLDFLDRGEGYCEQFAGAFAAIGRALGWPTRVAVGFTPGAVDPADPGRFIVQGRHAHAWPEVYFPEVGWVPFEPTPGRGMPGAQAHTGVAPEQDAGTIGDAASTTTTTSTTTPTSASTSTPAEDPTAPDEVGSAAAPPAEQEGSERSGDDRAPLVVGALGLGGVVLAAAWWLRRRRARALAPDPIERSWQRVVEQLVREGLAAPTAAETPVEVAARAAAVLPETTAVRLADLADAVTAARYAPEGLQEAAADRVAEIADEVLATSG